MLCIRNGKLAGIKDDMHEWIKSLIGNFFCDKTQYPGEWTPPDRANFEFTVCIDHLSRTTGYYLDSDKNMLPPSREIFQDILIHIAKDGNWFSADKIADHIRITDKYFSFCDTALEKSLKLKGEIITIDGQEYDAKYRGEFNPGGIIRHGLFVRPLFKAYCYIFASLGILEITQTEPPLIRKIKEKHHPVSLYDSLKDIRVTEFGLWCLGLSDKRPEKVVHQFEALADKNLFLVTVQGVSLERQLYLDKIGEKLGENRWKISPASFISECTNKHHITQRIERFKHLIDPKPAPHWEELFKKVISRAGLFDKRRADMFIYDLPEDKKLAEELLRDPQFRQLVKLIEGKMIAVAIKDERKFHSILKEHGITHLTNE
jgi:hypothetical protein